MKKKYGPLPLWAWVVVIGGTIGVYLLYKSGSSSSTDTSTTDAELAAEQAAEEAAVGTTGAGGVSGDSGTTTPTAAVDNSGLQAELDAILANQAAGLQDGETPVQTFAGEVGDVTDGVSALASLASLFGGTTTIIQEPATTTKKATPLPALTQSGAIRLKSGPTKPTAPAGYTAVGIGNGNWEAVPIIKAAVNNTAKAASKATEATAEKKKTVAVKAQPVSGKKKK